MKSYALWRVSVTTAGQAEEAVAAVLERFFGQSPSIYSSANSQLSIVSAYVLKPVPTAKRHRLRAELQRIRSFGLDLGPAKISIQRVAREDWSESWKKYFKAIEIGSIVLIKPSWSNQRPKKNQKVVVLDPGLSFGTGQHPTTSFCLRQLATTRRWSQSQSFLDIGTGSGILAIAAAKLGYAPVRAFDIDPVAVRVAGKNAKRNRVADRIALTRSDLARLSLKRRTKYDLICANLSEDLLIASALKIRNWLRPDGRLVLAGILVPQFGAVRRAFASHGFKLAVTRIEGEWQSGVFIFGRQRPHAAVLRPIASKESRHARDKGTQ